MKDTNNIQLLKTYLSLARFHEKVLSTLFVIGLLSFYLFANYMVECIIANAIPSVTFFIILGYIALSVFEYRNMCEFKRKYISLLYKIEREKSYN